MKKIAFIMAIVVLLSFSGCQSKEPSASSAINSDISSDISEKPLEYKGYPITLDDSQIVHSSYSTQITENENYIYFAGESVDPGEFTQHTYLCSKNKETGEIKKIDYLQNTSFSEIINGKIYYKQFNEFILYAYDTNTEEIQKISYEEGLEKMECLFSILFIGKDISFILTEDYETREGFTFVLDNNFKIAKKLPCNLENTRIPEYFKDRMLYSSGSKLLVYDLKEEKDITAFEFTNGDSCMFEDYLGNGYCVLANQNSKKYYAYNLTTGEIVKELENNFYPKVFDDNYFYFSADKDHSNNIYDSTGIYRVSYKDFKPELIYEITEENYKPFGLDLFNDRLYLTQIHSETEAKKIFSIKKDGTDKQIFFES